MAQAKVEFSRVISEASEDAQVIENRGVEVAVVLGSSRYRELMEVVRRSEPSARMRRFLQLSAALRDAGGAELEVPHRERRASPFSKRKR